MENRNNILMISFVAIAVLLSWGLTKDFNERNAPLAHNGIVCKQDSLQMVIDSLKNERESLLEDISMLEDGFDFKERRYEEILFEYEYGIDHLKNYHPEAYKDFHRIIAHKERYSKQDERDNKQRLLNPQNF
jgi:hypothetical protein